MTWDPDDMPTEAELNAELDPDMDPRREDALERRERQRIKDYDDGIIADDDR